MVKYFNRDRCDICGEKKPLIDWFAMICNDCRKKHTNMVLIRRIGQLMNKIEDLENK